MEKHTFQTFQNSQDVDFVVEPEYLDKMRSDSCPKLVIVDMRGTVAVSTNSDGSQSAEYLGAAEKYNLGHIPGAIYIDWTKDIVDLSNPVPVQVASPEDLAALFGSVGIGTDTEVIAYDDHPASQFATRLWWVFKLLGRDNVKILNGGWKRWTAEGRQVSQETPRYAACTFIANFDPEWVTTADELFSMLKDGNVLVIDARDEAQFTGKISRGIRGGHIPGAIHVPREAIFKESGEIKSAQELQQVFEETSIIPGDSRRIVAYCNGGVAATSVLFALNALGCGKLTNYDGSWNEWNLRIDLPIEL